MNTEILKQYFFNEHVPFVEETLNNHNYQLVFVGSRQTRLGTFDFNPNRGYRRILLNHDLDKYLMWFVFLHEYAHFLVDVEFGGAVKPHGTEWKITFGNLLSEHLESFPTDLRPVIQEHAKKPKANLTRHPELWYYFYPERKNKQRVKHLMLNDHFAFNGRIFKLKEKRRTRYLCEDVESQRLYTIHGEAEYTHVIQ